MSLILDALRKSEAERRRGEAPSLYSNLPKPGTRQQPAWLRAAAWVVAAVLLLVALFVFLTREPGPATRNELERSAAQDAAAGEADLAPASEPVTASNAPTPAMAAAPISPAPAPAPASPAAPAPTVDALVQPAASRAAQPTLAPAPPAPIEITPATPSEEQLPPLAVLEASTRNALPPLKLSMHVYNSEPARRFAIIDGQRVTEGAQLGAAIVTEIRRDGVVLDVAGRRVLVPRP